MESVLMDPWAAGEVDFAVRYGQSDQVVDMDRKLREAWPRDLHRAVDLQISGGVGQPPMHRDQAVDGFYRELKSLADSLDIRLREEHRWAAADIGFVPDGLARMDGLGPVGDRPVRGEEYVIRHSLLERAALVALIINSVASRSS